MTGANLGLSLTLNLEQFEDLAGHDDEAGVVVCIIFLPLTRFSISQYWRLFVHLHNEMYIVPTGVMQKYEWCK